MATHYQGSVEERRALDLLIKLARAADSFFDRIDDPVQASGLTMGQFGVLETLYHLGPQKPSGLAEKHLRSRNNLTVVLDNMERDGLITRSRCPRDRRSQWVHLTDIGRARIEAVLPPFVRGVLAAASALTPQEQAQLGDLLRKLGRGEPASPA